MQNSKEVRCDLNCNRQIPVFFSESCTKQASAMQELRDYSAAETGTACGDVSLEGACGWGSIQ
ncbi:hypothetical protein IWQ52_004901 [Labrenzia sp. EL_159]|nr:hypothetical protein [Labrenzia sp. EL_162]MBG6175428.1 hypothetical protein [Labrenzia sp. EL_132]MBG6197354.1 hypothetical protein [Labrenzia sp. EL_159]